MQTKCAWRSCPGTRSASRQSTRATKLKVVLAKEVMVPEVLEVKVGASVILLKNIDDDFVNLPLVQ